MERTDVVTNYEEVTEAVTDAGKQQSLGLTLRKDSEAVTYSGS